MIRSGGKSTKHPLQCCSVRRVLSRCLITEKHMGRHRCTSEERDLSEGQISRMSFDTGAN